MKQISVYMEISDSDRVLPSLNDEGLCDAPSDLHRVEMPSSTPSTHSVTFRAFLNEASFRAQGLNSRHQQQKEVPIRFPHQFSKPAEN